MDEWMNEQHLTQVNYPLLPQNYIYMYMYICVQVFPCTLYIPKTLGNIVNLIIIVWFGNSQDS